MRMHVLIRTIWSLVYKVYFYKMIREQESRTLLWGAPQGYFPMSSLPASPTLSNKLASSTNSGSTPVAWPGFGSVCSPVTRVSQP